MKLVSSVRFHHAPSRALGSLLAGLVACATVLSADAAHAQSATASASTETTTTTQTATTRTTSEATRPPREPADPLVEKHDHWYLSLGAGYRGTVLPAFELGAFVDGAPTSYFSTIKVSADFRKNGFSIVPSLSFNEFGSGDILFKQHGKDATVNGNWSVVNSNIKMMAIEADLLWSVAKLHRMVDLEVGLNVGVGMTFGGMLLNWVYADPSGKYKSGSGQGYSLCQSNVNPSGTSGCQRSDHSGSETERVGNYREPSWFNGGSKPSFLPILSPQIGVRIKPHKNFVSRVGFGWGLYGPWFGVSGYYSFDKPIAKSSPPRTAPRGSEEEVVETSE